MLIGSILRIRCRTMDREVMILFWLSLVECGVIFVTAGCWAAGLFMLTEEVFIQRFSVAFFLIIVLSVALGYRKIILGGFFCFRLSVRQKQKRKWHRGQANVSQCIRESHYLSRFSGDRYYRYYLKIEWKDVDGKLFKGRSNYFFEWENDKKNLKYVSVYVNEENMSDYWCTV